MATCGGGTVPPDDSRIAERVRLMPSHGQKERYLHTAMGYNLRMTEIQAALGLVQLEKLERFTQQRIANAAFLTEYLHEAVQTPVTRPGCRHVYHQYTIRVPGKRDEWAKRLRQRGIGTAIHYPTPIHQQPFYRGHLNLCRFVSAHEKAPTAYAVADMRLPVAETAAQQVLSLPVHPALTHGDLITIVKEMLKLCD